MGSEAIAGFFDLLVRVPTDVFLKLCYLGVLSILIIPACESKIPSHFFCSLKKVSLGAAWSCVGLLVVAVLLYPFVGNYLDHVEAEIAALSFTLLRGGELYPALEAGEPVYGLVYGPFLFMANAIPLYFDESILGSKLSGTVLLCLALFLCSRISSLTSDDTFAAHSLFLLGALLILKDAIMFSNRAEPLLLLSSSIALYGFITLRAKNAALVIGVAAGMATSVKVHGFLYVAPVAAAFLALVPSLPKFISHSLIGVGAATLLVGLTFLPDSISLERYVEYIFMTLDHGIGFHTTILSSLYFFVLALIPLVLYRVSGYRPSGSFIILVSSLLLCCVLILFSSFKNGAGAHYLVPFVPYLVFLCAKMSRSLSESPNMDGRSAAIQGRISILLFFAVLTFGTIDIRHAFRVAELASLHEQHAEKAAELLSFSNKYPRTEMGVAENDSYLSSTLLYPLLVFEKQDRPEFTAAAWMDLSYAGLEEELATDLVTNCRVPFWSIPSTGKPFSMPNWYTGDELFSTSFKTKFFQSYEVIDRGKYFDVWSCEVPR